MKIKEIMNSFVNRRAVMLPVSDYDTFYRLEDDGLYTFEKAGRHLTTDEEKAAIFSSFAVVWSFDLLNHFEKSTEAFIEFHRGPKAYRGRYFVDGATCPKCGSDSIAQSGDSLDMYCLGCGDHPQKIT